MTQTKARNNSVVRVIMSKLTQTPQHLNREGAVSLSQRDQRLRPDEEGKAIDRVL